MGRSRKKRVSRSPGKSGSQRNPPKSKLRSVRLWIISAVLAGLAATISGAIVNFSNTTTNEFKRILGINDAVVTQAGPVIATQVTQGFATCSGGSGWVFPKSASAAYTTSPAKGPTHQGQTWVSDPGSWGAVEA